MDTDKVIRNALDLNQAAIFTAEHGEETHLPLYYSKGAQRVAHISPLPKQRAVIQVWAVKEAYQRKQKPWRENALGPQVNLWDYLPVTD
jgi:hypothetical protein